MILSGRYVQLATHVSLTDNSMDLFIECPSSLQAANFRRAIFFPADIRRRIWRMAAAEGLGNNDPLLPPSEFAP